MTDHLLTPRQELILGAALHGVGIASGLAMACIAGLPLLWIGMAGVFCSLLYPYLKYHALGDVAIAISYALLPAIGTSLVAIGSIDWQSLLVIIPVGLITVAILHANNTRDITTDARAGIYTLSMTLGLTNATRLYALWITSPLAFIVAYVCGGIIPEWSLLTLLAVPMIVANLKAPLANLDECTAKLQLIFSILLSISFVL